MSYADLSENQSIAMLLGNLMFCPLGYLIGAVCDKQGCNKKWAGMFLLGVLLTCGLLGGQGMAVACSVDY